MKGVGYVGFVFSVITSTSFILILTYLDFLVISLFSMILSGFSSLSRSLYLVWCELSHFLNVSSVTFSHNCYISLYSFSHWLFWSRT